MAHAGYIYAIGATGSPWVKIGCTRGAVTTRLRTLQTGHPLALYVIAAVAVPAYLRRIEHHVHMLLDTVPRQGEWFDVSIEADTLATLVARATARATQESGLLSQRIKRLRDKKGWNQTELADRAAVQQSLLSKIEKGSPQPDD